MPSSEEWQRVASMLRTTLPRATLHNVDRIQNKWLWDKYAQSRERLKRKNGTSNVNERLLFHGTRQTEPKQVSPGVIGEYRRRWGCQKGGGGEDGAKWKVGAGFGDGSSNGGGGGGQVRVRVHMWLYIHDIESWSEFLNKTAEFGGMIARKEWPRGWWRE